MLDVRRGLLADVDLVSDSAGQVLGELAHYERDVGGPRLLISVVKHRWAVDFIKLINELDGLVLGHVLVGDLLRTELRHDVINHCAEVSSVFATTLDLL